MDEERLRELAAEEWYHTIELAPGLTSDGMFDHRPYVDRYGLPESLAGKRVLDVGTFEGFWAFELERRGAEVVALDVPRIQQLDWPPRQRPAEDEPRGERFRAVAEAKGSAVKWVGLNVYDATPEELGGTFDLVFCGTVTIHLRDPALALERMAGLCHGDFVFADEYSRKLEWTRLHVAEWKSGTHMTWWRPTTPTWMSMVRVAGFEDVRHHGRYGLPFRDSRKKLPHTIIHARGPAERAGSRSAN